MNFLKDFKTEIKTIFIVTFIAVVISVGAILLLKTIQSEPYTSSPSEFSNTVECGGQEDIQCPDNSECLKIDPLPGARGICEPKESVIFAEDKPGIPVTDELLEKMKEKLLGTGLAQSVTSHDMVRAELNGDGIEEIVATWVPSKDSIPEFGIFQIVDIEGNYKKIASFDFHIFSSPLAMDVPLINIAEDINGDGMSEIHVGWLTGSVRPTRDDIFLIFDPQKRTLSWMEVVDKQGRQVPSRFMGARGANSGGTWFYRLAVGNLDSDQSLEIVQIYQNSTSLYETGNIEDTDWRVETYDWDGNYYRYSERLSATGKGTLPQEWQKLKTISFVGS